MKIPKGYHELSTTEKVEPGDEFYSKTFADWYAVKDAHIGHLAKAELFRRPEMKEEIDKVNVGA